MQQILSGRKIREAMREKGWTQQDLANRAGLTQAAVSYILKSPNPLLSSALAIAKALEVDINELLEDAPEDERHHAAAC